MENQLANPAAVGAPPRRWPLFLTGVLLFVLGPAIYFAQVRLKHFGMPWPMLILAAVGVLFMAVSVWTRRGVLRTVGLALFALVCGLEWAFVLVITRTPPYEGPAQLGQKVPEFTAAYADGRAFTRKDLEGDRSTVLLFFRGHW